MNRREFAGAAIAALAVPAGAQVGKEASPFTADTTLSTNSTLSIPVTHSMSMEERKKEYEICKVRGHQANNTFQITSNVVLTTWPPQYSAPRSVCKFCGTTFWTETVVTEHEDNVPK